MGDTGQGLNPQVLEDLQFAIRGRQALAGAGVTAALWEIYALAHQGSAALKREVARLLQPGADPQVRPPLLEELRLFRNHVAPILRKLRRFLPPESAADPDRLEFLHAFVAASGPALEAVELWATDPIRNSEESDRRLRLIEGIVDRYRAALQAQSPAPASPAAAAPPSSPRGLRAQPSHTEITLAWDPVPGATAYVLQRSGGAAGPFSSLASPTSNSYTDTGLADGTLYYYVVSAVVGSVQGPPSAPVSSSPVAPPPAPRNVTVVPGSGRITLRWESVPGAHSYAVRRASSPAGPFELVATPASGSHTDDGVTNGASYFYVVTGRSAGGEGPASAPVQAVPVPLPSPPQELVAEARNAAVRLHWSPVPDALHYRVMRSATPGGPYTAIGNPRETVYADADVANGTTYYYVVRAVNAAGKGPYSEQQQATPVAPPAPPAGLEASPGHSQIALSWPSSPRATGYVVRRAASPEGPFTTIASPAAPSFVDCDAVNGTTSFYAVRATNAGGESPDSPVVSGTALAPPPSPAELAASPGNGQIVLAWQLAPRATSYVVRRAASPGGPWASVGRPSAPPFTDTGLVNGSTYHYMVSAANAGGESAPGAPVACAPTAPPALVTGLAAAAGNGRVTLSWTPASRAAGYVLRRALRPEGPFGPLAHAAGSTCVDGSVSNGSSYYYTVAAVNAGGEGPPSAAVEASPIAAPPAPTGLSAAAGRGRVSLAWSPAARATRYSVRRATAPGGPFEEVAAPVEPSFADTGLENGVTYHYAVAASNAGGEGPPSAPVQAAPVEPPPAPAGLVATPGNAQIQLSWSPVPGVTSYHVRRSNSPGGPYVTIAGPAVPACLDSGLRNATSYFYVVAALNAGGEGPASAEVSAAPVCPPAPPASVTALAGNGRVALSWPACEGALRYRVKRGLSPAGPFALHTETQETSCADEGVANGTAYAYVVSALNAGGEGRDSAPVLALPLAPPAPPSQVFAQPGNGRVALSWSPSARAARYSVRRAATPAGPFVPVGEAASPAHADEGLENGISFHYVVVALNSGGESPPSAPVQASPLAPPASPAGLAAAPGNAQVSLSWTPVPEAAAYHVRRAAAREGPFEALATTPESAWLDATVSNGGTYLYTVAATNAGGESPASDPVEALPVAPPAAPAGLRAAGGNGRVELRWEAVPGAARYEVRRSTTPGGPAAAVATTAATEHVDESVSNGTAYHYAVSALNAGGPGPESERVEASPVAPPPAPTGLVATSGDAKASLAWTASPGAALYRVRRSAEFKGPYATVAETAGTSHVDGGLANGGTYFYYVVALNAGGESIRTSRVRARPLSPPAVPQNVAAAPGNGLVVLTWDAAERAARYRIRRAAERRGPYTSVGTAESTTYTDTEVANGSTYWYVVVASNSGGKSGHSKPVSATPIAPPGSPDALEAAAGNGRVRLAWPAVPGATHYRLLRSGAPGEPPALVSSPTTNEYEDLGLRNGTIYRYAVAAVNAGGESGLSPMAAAQPAAPPPAPAGLDARPGPGLVRLSWRPVAGATSYRVKRAEAPLGPFQLVGHPIETEFTDAELSNGRPYYYVISSVSASGEGPDSALAPALPREESPLPPETPREPLSPPADLERRQEIPLEATTALVVSVRAPSEEVPTLESLDAPAVGAVAAGIDVERLLDLRRLGQLRGIFEETAQKIEAWEVLCLVAEDPTGVRSEMERLSRLKEKRAGSELTEAALAFFERLLKIRSQHGAAARRLAAYLELLGLKDAGEAGELAIAFLVSAARSRQRAERWLEDPDGHRRQALTYLEHTLKIARRYVGELSRRA
jgi:fibronectin type 3 domain-containing protein